MTVNELIEQLLQQRALGCGGHTVCVGALDTELRPLEHVSEVFGEGDGPTIALQADMG